MSKPLNLEEAAAFLGYTKESLQELVYQGKIPHYKPNHKKIYFRQEDLEAYCYRGRVSADYELGEKADAILNNAQYKK
jgi:excisionase family DNA binding protein